MLFLVIVPLPQPQNVTVVSNNFDTVLHWSPGVGHSKLIKKCMIILLDDATNTLLFAFVFDSAYLGPPSVTLAGCGNCFNISISLPDRVSSNESLRFYKGIRFDIHWKKAGDEKQHSKKLSIYTHALLNLEQGGKYCVRAKPRHNVNKNAQVSDWICDFTSTVQKRGVSFIPAFVTSVAGWTAGFVLIGLGLLIFTASLAYAGFLCKLKRSLPKTLRLRFLYSGSDRDQR
uniref:Fibronectin type-III domain-containing protein n=1 Tax=Pygocentrus nattereri TaxID=42514 RepID=A0A3B4BT56_PYGNA